MKRNNISTIFLVILGLQFFYFLYQLRNVIPFVLNNNILLCDSCLHGLISTIIIIALTLSVLAGLSLAISHIKTFQFKNKIKRSVVSKPKSIAYFEKKHNLHNKIIIYQDSQLMAFCLGVFTPHIYLSTQLLKKMKRSEVEAILLHEKQHMVGGDNMKLLILNFIKTVFFFFPIISDFVRSVEIQKEISADQAVVRTTGNKRNIVSALKKCIESKPSYVHAHAFSERLTIEPRIHSLVGKRNDFLSFQTNNIFITFIVVLMLSNISLGSIEVHSQTGNSATVCLGNGACQNICH